MSIFILIQYEREDLVLIFVIKYVINHEAQGRLSYDTFTFEPDRFSKLNVSVFLQRAFHKKKNYNNLSNEIWGKRKTCMSVYLSFYFVTFLQCSFIFCGV